MAEGEGDKATDRAGERRNLIARIVFESEEFARAVRVTRLALRSLARSDIPRMAAALSYRTIFSLVPVLVVVAAVAGSFVSDDQLEQQIIDLLDRTGISRIVVSSEETVLTKPRAGPIAILPDDEPVLAPDQELGIPAVEPDGERQSSDGDEFVGDEDDPDAPKLSQAAEQMGLDEWITGLVDRVKTIRLDAIGIIGALLLIWAAISMLLELEGAFNAICACQSKRGMVRRITTYWTVLTLGMLLLFATFRGGALVGDWVTVQLATVHESWGNILGPLVTRLLNLIMNAGLLVLAYMTVPNASIRFRPAIVGAAVAGTLWEVAKSLFALYLESGGIEKLYGALALIPLFLLWMYVTWVLVLLGLQIAYALQHFDAWVERHNAVTELARPIALDPASALAVAAVVVSKFDQGERTTIAQIVDETHLREEATQAILDRLVQRNVLISALNEEDEPTYSLARPAQSIPARAAFEAGLELTEAPHGHADDAIQRVRNAREKAIEGLTLADLARRPEQDPDAPAPNARPATA